MKPKKSTVLHRLAPLMLLLTSTAGFAQPAGDLAAHRTEDEVKDSIKAALPFLEDKVASTLQDGASAPVAFHGQIQMYGKYHNYYDLADSSYLYLARQGLLIGNEGPLLKLGMVVSPGRNTVLWSEMGIHAAYSGVNQTSFLHPDTTGYTGAYGYSNAYQHHSANKTVGLGEGVSAGIAIRTKPASFMLKMGAVNWTESSPLSIWKDQARIFAWEYSPYTIEEPISSYYKANIADGKAVGRSAWNKKAFQGVEFSITDLPGGVEGFFLYGAGNPYDLFERNSMDLSVDLDYQADMGGVVGAGIGDSYRKQTFYRVSKKILPSLEIGFSNGFSRTSEDIVKASASNYSIFNDKFNVGMYGSVWNIDGKRVTLKDAASMDTIASKAAGDTAVAAGGGFWLEPTYFSFDVKGNVAGKVTYKADIGMTMLDTNYVTITNKTYGNPLRLDESGNYQFNYVSWNDEDKYADESSTTARPGNIESSRKSGGLNTLGIAAYGEATYHGKVQVGVDALFANKKYYSPYSMVTPVDVFFARGSNLVGEQNFLGNEASPYTSNMAGLGFTVEPKVPWYGHLRVKHGINAQLDASGRDVLYLPYRLNGSSMVSSLNHYYAKWGIGKITQSYPFMHNQGHMNLADGGTSFYEGGYVEGGNDSLAKAPVSRLGDESYGGDEYVLSPTSGGMRAADFSVYEGFVPYKEAKDVILNHFAQNRMVSMDRDLSELWIDSTFVDVRGNINRVRVIEDGDTTFYSMTAGSDVLTVTDSSGNVLDTSTVLTQSSTGFVPTSQKVTANLAFDWAMDIGKYIGYENDLFLTLYYEMNGISRGVADDILLVSHYIRSEPSIALSKSFYLIGLLGWEQWSSKYGWIRDDYDGGIGFKKGEFKTTDIALGLGFDWDFVKRVSLHGRYKWYNHKDSQLSALDYSAHSVGFELKAFF